MLVFTVNTLANKLVILDNTLGSERAWIAPKLGLCTSENYADPYIAVGSITSNVHIVLPANFIGSFIVCEDWIEQLVSQCKQIDSPDVKYVENFKRIKMK